MSEEKNTEEKSKCFCKNEGIAYFLTTTIGTFVGVYLALLLSNAFLTPQMPPNPVPMPQHQMQGHGGPHPEHGDFGKPHDEFRDDMRKEGRMPERND